MKLELTLDQREIIHLIRILDENIDTVQESIEDLHYGDDLLEDFEGEKSIYLKIKSQIEDQIGGK